MERNRQVSTKKAALLLALCALMLCACAPQDAVPHAPTPTPDVAVIEFSAPQPTPVIRSTPVRVLDAAQDAVLPKGYTRLPAAGAGVDLFAFTDTAGARQYRVLCGYEVWTDGVMTDAVTDFYACDASGAVDFSAAAPVDPENEPLGVCTPSALPGDVRLLPGLTDVDGGGHIMDADGNHYVFGLFPGAEPGAFYPADEGGAMLPGALPAEAALAEPAYVPTEAPTHEGERYLVVYIGTQSVVSYLAEDGRWSIERVMACSTGRRRDATPRGDFRIMQQYRYKKMGKVSGENVYAQYASRITGSYLFHSVPIAGDKRAQPAYGRQQMVLSYYERLGTPASGGCVRLPCADAYWLYLNCATGTRVTITDDPGPMPPAQPALIYEQPYVTGKDLGWDPSDPDPDNPYHAVYAPEFVASPLE